ncbi:MAG: DUF4173 domain-containing protein [Flavobacteriales bacterium]|nr:DUF4173 domain-containing protein [Flavobacteriales bacterium]
MLLILLVAVLFDGLFWDRTLGLNLTLFVPLLIGSMSVLHGGRGLSVPARVAMLGALVAGGMVYVHNSTIAVFGVILALMAMSAFMLERELRSLPFAMASFFSNLLMVPVGMVQGMDGIVLSRNVPRKGWRWTKLAVLPILVVVLFFQLYRAGNSKFDHLAAGLLDGLFQRLGSVLEKLFTPHSFFFLFALLLSAGLLHRFAPAWVLGLERPLDDRSVRIRSRRPHWMAPRAMDPLERERRMGVILLVIVNLLLLVVNIIDIDWVWWGFEVPRDFSLKQFVHEGTWMLIVSILLSMVIIMFLFRGNQNFYSRSGSLKHLAMMWVVQNFILGISVFLRNYHYISFHGLAYKRIGVIVFLALVLVGLVTLFLKVRNRKSLYFLARVNGWAAFILLIGLTTVDWDSFIVRTNLRHANPGEIDVDNYLSMSDKVLPLLYANFNAVQAQMERHRANRVVWVDHLDPETFRLALDDKRDRFLHRYLHQDPLEDNLADRRTMSALGRLGHVAITP